MSLKRKNNLIFGPALVGALLAVAISVPLAAVLGGQFGDTYGQRAAVYLGLLGWVVIGAVSVFLATWKNQPKALSAHLICLWFVSTWLWPIPLFMWWKAKNRDSFA